VFVKPPAGWRSTTQIATLTASDGREGDEFGYSLAASGSLIVAGDPSHRFTPASAGPGAVYVFRRPAGGWENASQTATLRATNGGDNEGFGWAVTASGDGLATSAPHYQGVGRLGDTTNRGAIYVFGVPRTNS